MKLRDNAQKKSLKIFSNIFRSKPEMKGFDAKVINKNMKKMQQDTSKIKKDQDIRIV